MDLLIANQPLSKLKIALDFDETYTADPELWQNFVKLAVSRGHEVKIVTYRYGGDSMPPDMLKFKYANDDVEEASKLMNIPVIYCNATPKRDCYDAHIWIDDYPELIVKPTAGAAFC